ncbi:hypothetical protein BOO29_10905 [Vibrio navarrensis]|uniref:YdaS family helix-turn-helix protein n=1 Tax=Vibrio TaxID=662 RepID=UPI00068CBA39|nr:YdaS family helix-turn-helix protein [Vibrio cholerae]EGQ8175203.1 helix-turn-helix domain-containing protein [Vibrio vulnificus]MBE4585470.1 hypothetical protein [Vibrio navarrensis]MBJ6896842.1 helix-turn-helix domain-containing protein [Vibrio cholerae]RZQ90934.1 helix-turn-helix domain-containing protein [Vibrio vulnificus]HAS8144351.1 helix-turn-helix domain-containing protein [Vibrio vulnificus]
MLKEAINEVGIQKIAEHCDVSVRAVYKWCSRGVLPRTEYTGETQYAQTIEELSDGKFTKSELLNLPR